MKPGDRIGIVGPNGAGKTTLIKTILGLEPPDAGEVVLGANTRPAYLEQGRSELRDELTVLEEVGDGYDYVELPDGRVHVRSFLRMLAFPDSVADTKVGQLSGGERNRVQLARLLRRGGNLLVLDEPTNDLDLLTLGALEEGLSSFPGCALIVSHDRWFLDRVATGDPRVRGRRQGHVLRGQLLVLRRAPGRARRASRSRASAEPRRARQAPSATAPRKLTFKEKAGARGHRGRRSPPPSATSRARGDALGSERVQGSRRRGPGADRQARRRARRGRAAVRALAGARRDSEGTALSRR